MPRSIELVVVVVVVPEPPGTQWTELDRILQLDADTNGAPFFWTDAWGMYEDVCLVCARLCSGLWRSGSSSSSSNGDGNGTSGLCDQWSWAGSPRE